MTSALRSTLDVLIDDYWHRMAFAASPELCELWKKRWQALWDRRAKGEINAH